MASKHRLRPLEASSTVTGGGATFGISTTKYRVSSPPGYPLPTDELDFGWLVRDLRDHLRPGWPCEFEEKAISLLDKYNIAKFEDEDKDENDRFFDMFEMDTESEVRERDVHLSMVLVPECYRTQRATVFIYAPWSNDAMVVWPKVVGELMTYMQDWLAELSIDEFKVGSVGVEMRAPELDPLWGGLVCGRPDVQVVWPAVKKEVATILNSFETTKAAWLCISLVLVGRKHHTTGISSVYVALDYSSRQVDWPPVEHALQNYLDTLGLSLEITVEHNTIQDLGVVVDRQDVRSSAELYGRRWRGACTPHNNTPEISLGADISSCKTFFRDGETRLTPGYGTLGCYIEIKMKNRQGWETFALTSYEAVRSGFDGYQLREHTDIKSSEDKPAPGSDLSRIDREGLTPADHKKFPKNLMRHPSDLKHGFSMWLLEEHIRTINRYLGEERVSLAPEELDGYRQRRNEEKKGYESDIDAKNTFISQKGHLAGEVWAASGNRRRTVRNARLNWALLEVPEQRRGSNELPSKASWKEKGRHAYPVPDDHTYLHLGSGEAMGDGKDKNVIFKVGAASGQTKGLMDEFTSSVRVWVDGKLDEPSDEHMCVEKFDRFAELGDTGAVVFDRHCRALGMLSTGVALRETALTGAYMTPMEDVLDDIKALCGEVEDIRILQTEKA
ncbi:hypothetical protein ACHAQA_009923 [Verticillium albo-atrum]